jgi:uncharacterized membrane protein
MTFPSALRTVAVAMILPALLGGCAGALRTSTVTTGGGEQPAASDPDAPFARVYTCPDGFRFSARADDGAAHLDLGTRRATLDRVASESGQRYTDGETLLHVRGDQATIEADASIRTGCRARDAADPWQAAALRGVDMRALGQEPGWAVEVKQGDWMRLLRPDGNGVLVAPDPVRETTGSGATVYTGRADGQRLRLHLRESACTDSMSGESFPLTATLTLDGRELRGCARRPGADR